MGIIYGCVIYGFRSAKLSFFTLICNKDEGKVNEKAKNKGKIGVIIRDLFGVLQKSCNFVA